jgi:predicted site-specific integrase-resolvase
MSSTPQAFFTERQLADRWHMSKRTLQRWRKAGTGPSWILIGGRVRYPASEVMEREGALTSVTKGKP